MSKATQAERILSYLKRKGYPIDSEMEPVKNRYGETSYIKRYSMAVAENGH